MQPYDTKELEERVILVGVQESFSEDVEESLDELAELCETAGALVVGRVIQNREKIHPGTYVGKGKIEELKSMIWELRATGIVCDDELSPAQMKNLQELLDTKVMDRTLVILDIFAARASTSEGKIQVELAQLRYRASRLAGLGRSLSRLGGGIGTRGPGEKKLEMDRRLIRERISRLKKELADVERHRELLRSQRNQSGMKVAALVGYTSAGKSSIENALTNAGILEDAMLFSTLDTTTRALQLDGTQEILLTDTVGFIRKLPHHLIEAFKSTLEEAKYADYIIHVVDASNPQRDKQMYIVYETLDHLGVKNKKILTLFNKIDIRTDDDPLQDFRADHVLQISATENAGLDAVKDVLQEMLREDKIYNGQIGIIKHINKVDEEIFVYFPYEEQLVKYDISLLKKDYLGLAYALTAHKCQGNEFKDVIMIVSNEDSFMLNSNYLYSAMTRAKENLHIVGELEAILNGLKNKNIKDRQTILRLIGEKQK